MSNLYYYRDGNWGFKTNISQMTFPGGEVGININTGAEIDEDVETIQLMAHIQNSNDAMALFLATDALRYHFPRASVILGLAYVPYARQDRRCNPGEANSAAVFCRLINSQNYAAVNIFDPHSLVVPGVLERCQVHDQYDAFAREKLSWIEYTLVAPDLGAVKKVEDFAKRVGARGVVVANKKRELSTGKIIGLEILGDAENALRGANLVVLDDICDGGRTFIELAQLLKQYDPARLELFVSHGIFSKGIEVLNMYDQITTTNSFNPALESDRLLRVVKI